MGVAQTAGVGLTRHLFTMSVPYGHSIYDGGRVVDVNDLSIARVVHLRNNSQIAVLGSGSKA